MTQKSLVSVLIPCYNAEKWLSETIESALAQTWQNIEIIITDDGSTDASLSIARAYEGLGVKVISQPNRGASAARNRALMVAQGDFIQYLDADDLLATDKIERQITLLRESSERVVASSEWARFYRSPAEALFNSHPLWTDKDPIDFLVCAWKMNWMMHPAAWLIPRKIVEEVEPWNEALSLNDDGEYFCRIALSSTKIKFCPNSKVYYRSGNSSSLSASVSVEARQSQFLSLRLCVDALLKAEDSPRTRSACATIFQRFVHETYPDSSDLCAAAAIQIQQLGGSDLKPGGGPVFQLVSRTLGWRRAKRIQKWAYELGYGKVAFGWKLAKLKERIAYSLSSDNA